MSKKLTENGDLSYNTTGQALLDFFATGGALRSRPDSEVIRIFTNAFAEDGVNTLKALFYFRDIRGGQGERRLFRTITRDLANSDPKLTVSLLPLFSEYGRWDDLLALWDTNSQVREEVFRIVVDQLTEDGNNYTIGQPISLLAKWMPSANTSSKETRKLAKAIIKEMGIGEKRYRQQLSALRSRLKVVEKDMSANKWTAIKYESVPSKAMLNYRKAFSKHDADGFQKYLDSVEKGEVTIKATTLYPYELYDRARSGDRVVEEQWKALPNYVKEDENALVMADVSGSMFGGYGTTVSPISVSVSLAIYFAERNKGVFKDHFMTFSARPQLQKITATTLAGKVKQLNQAHWDMNTDLGLALDTILQTAIKHKVPQEELPKRLYIISDMEFDSCVRGGSGTYGNAKANFAAAGYQIPEVVFWNVSARNDTFPVQKEPGVSLVSGFSPSLFGQLVAGLTPAEQMMQILSKERYKPVEEAIKQLL